MANMQLLTRAYMALPALSGESLTYVPEKNAFLTQGYTSLAGNTYYRAIRLSNRLVACYDLGQGYSATFLNGIKLFFWDGNKAKLIAHRTWGGYDNYFFFSETTAKDMCVIMLKDSLKAQIKMYGGNVGEAELMCFARCMVDGLYQRQLA